MIYADDTQIYHHCHPCYLPQGLASVQQDAQALADWARENGLTLNPRKCKAMILGSEFYVSKINLGTTANVCIDYVPIPFVNEACNLGVWITHTLNWSLHVKHVLRKVYPSFDYACAVYHDLDATRNLKLQRALNACVRFVEGSIPYRAHVTQPRTALAWGGYPSSIAESTS